MKEKSLNAGLNVPATLDIAPHKNHKTQISSSIVCFLLDSKKITHSTGNYFYYDQSKWILIWSTNKNVVKDKSWMYLRHLTSSLRKITKHKAHLQSSVFWLNQIRITHSTGNEFFYGQSRGIFISSTNKNVIKDKSLNAIFNVPVTLDIAPQKNHKTQISSSIVCLLLKSNKNYTFKWKWLFLWLIQVDFDLKHK